MPWLPRAWTLDRDRDLTSADEARRLAHLQFGGVPRIEEGCRPQRRTRWLTGSWRDPDRLVMVWSHNTRDGRVQNPLSPADLLDLQRSAPRPAARTAPLNPWRVLRHE